VTQSDVSGSCARAELAAASASGTSSRIGSERMGHLRRWARRPAGLEGANDEKAIIRGEAYAPRKIEEAAR